MMLRPQKVSIRRLPATITLQQVVEAAGNVIKPANHVDFVNVRKRVSNCTAVILHFPSSQTADHFLRSFNAAQRLAAPSAEMVASPWQRIIRQSDPLDKKENTYREDPLWLKFKETLRAVESTVPSRGQFTHSVNETAKAPEKMPELLSPLVNELVLRHAAKVSRRGSSRRRGRKQQQQQPHHHNHQQQQQQTHRGEATSREAAKAAAAKEKRRRKREAKARRSKAAAAAAAGTPVGDESLDASSPAAPPPPPPTKRHVILRRPEGQASDTGGDARQTKQKRSLRQQPKGRSGT